MKQAIKIVFIVILVAVVIAAIGIQFVPVERTNPAAPAPLKADAAVTAVLQRSCYDCHSNETRWPWYAYVAPVSWLVAGDVKGARHRMNFSNWEGYPPDKQGRLAGHIMDEVGDGGMPLPNYLKMHPDAKLSDADVRVIDEWATQFPAADGGDEGMTEGDEDHDRDRDRDGDENHDTDRDGD
jgi:hypothetical protein